MTRGGAAAGCALALALCWWFWLRSPSLPASQADAGSEMDPIALPVEPTDSVAAQPPQRLQLSAAPPQAALAEKAADLAPSADTGRHIDPELEKPHGHPMEIENMRPPIASGPVKELKVKFANESFAGQSRQREAQLTAAVDGAGAPPGLLEQVQCKRSVCRLGMRWTGARMIHYLGVLSDLRDRYDRNLAVNPAIESEADGTRWLDVYVSVAR
jgi:hypothetical protein